MATAYSADMRLRVIGRVESGASRREAAEHYEVSPSTAVIWVKCFRETGRCAAKPRGGSTSPLADKQTAKNGHPRRGEVCYNP
jgi:transposase